MRRVLDGRERIVVADDGLTLHHHGYTENIAHTLLLALEQPDAAAGKMFNIADEEVLSVRQVVEIMAAALDHRVRDRVDALRPRGARPGRSWRSRSPPTGCSTSRAVRTDLGYHDRVPAREALARTARWLVAHPIARLHRGAHAHRPVRLRGRGPPDRRVDCGTRHRARRSSTTRSRATGSRTAGPEAAPGPGPSSRPERSQAATRFAPWNFASVSCTRPRSSTSSSTEPPRRSSAPSTRRMADGAPMVWVTDTKGRRVGIPADAHRLRRDRRGRREQARRVRALAPPATST